jgi:hypothetical protein
MFNDYKCYACPIPLYGNNVISPIMCHFNIPQPWSSQQYGITRIYHTIMKYNKHHYVMDVDGLSIWGFFLICWIVSTIDFFNYSYFSQSVALFVFLGCVSLNNYSSVTLLLVVTLTSTTFTYVVIVYVSIIGWIYTIIITFPWNIFCISTNFGQSVILCPFKPYMWHAYEDLFCGFWLGYVAFVTTTMVYSFFFLHVSILCFVTPQFV